MTTYELETACHNYLNGQEVGDVEATLADFMDNVIWAGMDPPFDLAEIDRIENAARKWFEAHA